MKNAMKVLTKSEQMAKVRNRDTRPEKELRSALWHAGHRYRLQTRVSGTRPDIVFGRQRVAIFVDGCFWHGCPLHYSKPLTRSNFWDKKLRDNLSRDRKQTLELESQGWTVIRVWEHDITHSMDTIIKRVEQALAQEERTGSDDDWRVIRVGRSSDGSVETREMESLRVREKRCLIGGPRVTGGTISPDYLDRIRASLEQAGQ